MVLFKRKGVSIPESKYVPENEEQPVWVIPETNEFFCTYDEYLTRLDFYQQKKFICELSGASCLTYFDARKRELQETKNVLRFFPEPLKEPILRMVQFSQTTRLDQLVDEIHTTVKEKYFVGEYVSVRFEEQRVRAKVVKADHGKGLYQVDDGKRVLEGDSSQLIRDRKLLSKPALRAFVKHSAYREPWLGAPWMVKTEYADQYGISTDVPSDIQMLKAQSERFTAGGWASSGGASGASGASGSNGSTPSATSGKDHKGQSTVLNFKQLTQNYLDSRNKAAKSLEEHLAPEFRQDDLFLLALCEEPLKNVINERCKDKPWPKWHRDSRLESLEKSKKVNHLLEIWLFSQFFSEFLGFSDSLTTFDDFIDGIIAKEVSLPVKRLHESILKMLVPEGGTELAIPLPEEEEEDGNDEGGAEDDDDDDEAEEDEEPKEEHKKEYRKQGKVIQHDEDGEEDGEEDEYEDNNHDKSPPAKRKKPNKVIKKISEIPAWIEQIGRRDFANGGWQKILAEILAKLSHVREWHPDTCQVIKLLCPEHEEFTNSFAQKAYSELPLPERVHSLMMLVRLLYNSYELREFLDSQYEIASKLRRKPLAKELKQTREELKTAQKLLSMTTDHDDATITSTDQIKNMVSELKLDSSFTVVQLKELIKSLEDQSEKKLKESQEAATTIARLDNQRMRLLGKDRFFNRYWWMDSNGIDQSGEFFMGRLWVQGPSPEDLEYFLSSHYADKFIEFRKNVTAEVTRVREQAKERRREREKLARQLRQEKLQKIKQQNETHEGRSHSNELILLAERKPILTEEDYTTHAAKTTATLNDLKHIEKRIRELIGVSQENGDLLSADETIELRQLEAEIIRINSLDLSRIVPSNKKTVRELAESEEIITRLSSWFKQYFPSCKQSTEPASLATCEPYQSSTTSLPVSLTDQSQTTPSVPTIDQGIIEQQHVPADPYQLASLQQAQMATNIASYANPSYPPPPNVAQQPMQWIVQQTTHGPMLYAIPMQQYQLLMQQYNTPPPVSENSDAYHAYLQQLSMQQAYMTQQLHYGTGYIAPPGQYGSLMMPYMAPQIPPQAYQQSFGAQISPHVSQQPQQGIQLPIEASQVQVPLTEVTQPVVAAAQPTQITESSSVAVEVHQQETSPEPAKQVQDEHAVVAKPVTTGVPKEEIEGKTMGVQKHEKSTGVKIETSTRPLPNSEYLNPSTTERISNRGNKPEIPTTEQTSTQIQPGLTEPSDKTDAGVATTDADIVDYERTPPVETEEQLGPLDLLSIFEDKQNVLLPHQWRYYETPEEVEQLLTYFFNLGNRETKLATAIRKAQPDINRIMNIRLNCLGKSEIGKANNGESPKQ